MNNNEISTSLSSETRLIELVTEAKKELEELQPEIEYLEDCITKLSTLREKETKLKTLILSLSRLVNSDLIDISKKNEVKCGVNFAETENDNSSPLSSRNYSEANDVKRNYFYPDKAISEVKNLLRTKNNLNYEIYKAVIINSGIATTEQIKSYLIENNIKQPQSGKGFEDVELKEISSRANYLVRKNILSAIGSGLFKSLLGWDN
ncbi:MAG: hypothetical protein WCK67_04805 [bacterium]